ncbi:SusD/RagB family nutrient-binding outer membrane lipoprotein [Membranihabitans marinus]|uniref:SusD/RagB family nutrient-binding outer membrane lipoprotein n=1 Tax=Membranihabitans marinus TaxID=1227546 RepID=UPI001F184C3C|nr:SusD/RagB family nutrient-binding outer membrane lipoprotein [Membranihabitans marinus]
MNKIIFKYISISILGMLMLSSCNDFFDVNTDPTKIDESSVTLKVLLPTIITSTADAQYFAATSAMNATHQLDNIQSGYYKEFSLTSAWTELYLRVFNNLGTMIDNAESLNAPHYVGVGKVLQALNLGLLTDCWENAPFSNALQGSDNISPAYDSQEELYNTLLSLLDESITFLQSAESDYSPANDDLFYEGDLTKWVKLANSLKARYLLHLQSKGDKSSEILSAVNAGFSSNDDDLQLIYNDVVANPWFFNIAKKITESIYTKTYGKYFIDMMNGTNYNVVDPRLPLIAELTEGATEYKGVASYIDDQDYTVLPTQDTWYMDPYGPLVIMSYAELKFIEAEILLNSNPTQSKTAYQNGITANMTKIGVEAGDIADYLANPTVDGSIALDLIMKEKYIASVFNVEAWNDMRRHNYSSAVYKNFVEPNFEERSQPILRAEYPDSEETRNSSNVNTNRKDPIAPMWKDL